jgi:hypothetical protein
MDPVTQVTPERRRLFKFSLRTVFILLTLAAGAAGWLGVQVNRREKEEAAIAQLEATKDGRNISTLVANPFGAATKDVTGEPGTPDTFFRGGPAWLTSLLGIDIFRARVKFTCSPPGNEFTWDEDDAGHRVFNYKYKTGLKDADMRWINQVRYLQLLSLEANEITDVGLARLDNLPYVENLSLSNTAITNEGLHALGNFPRLRILRLRGTNISDAAVSSLAKCRLLEQLDLGMTNMTADGVKSLQQQLPNCKIEN